MLSVSHEFLPELLTAFRSYLLEERSDADSTTARYVRTVDEMLRFCGADGIGVDPTTITRRQVIGFLRLHSADTEPSRPAWNNRLAAARAFFDFLIEEKEMSIRNVAKEIRRKKVKPKERLPPSFDESMHILDAVDRHALRLLRLRDLAIIKTFLHCSVRVSELCRLDEGQVDMGRPAFHSVQVKGGEVRVIPFNDYIRDALEQWLAFKRKHWGKAGQSEALFPSLQGNHLHPRTVEHLVARYARLAGIARAIGPHDLRHTSADEYQDGGTDIVGVQEQLGHKHISTTRRYTRRHLGKRQAATKKFGKRWQRREEQYREAQRKTAPAIS